MDIVLNRKGGVAMRDQLVAQLELRILEGQLGPGEKLPSVRALGRRLRLHPNTVSAAYRVLQASGHVEMRKGAGIFVRAAGASSLEAARDLDEMLQVARAAVERWLAAPPPSRMVVVDPSLPMAELLAAEMKPAVDLPVEPRSLAEIAATPALLEGALAVSLPYHVAALRRAVPRANVLTVTLEVGAAVSRAIAVLPSGGIVLVVSHSETVLPFADKLVRSLRGDELLVETRLLRDRAWRRLLPAADLVFADALSTDALGRARTRGVMTFRVVGERALAQLASAALAAQSAGPAMKPAPPKRARRG
jgi:GntR family transcriptional regulator